MRIDFPIYPENASSVESRAFVVGARTPSLWDVEYNKKNIIHVLEP
jgi:hypothetical protein